MGVRRSSKLSQLIGAKRLKKLTCLFVDGDTKRFMIHTKLLRHVEFLKLLNRSAEEYGFCSDGVLRIPYEAKDFEEYWMIKMRKPNIYRVQPV
ncbi:hypothetical protein D8674_041746 [Pyrus ussuriensis x Pyrus communis]|uniref:Uncharacterized protein n=1 Tax=Pyrus ussuriensis x Pyrus communis TaxID=2448454 RepID=A0A5N5GFP6_9ROSA|nr:hypothetical protein D8674_041746 [Pyrus ussuriensis x Pyrus communis]